MNTQAVFDLSLVTLAVTEGGWLAAWSLWWMSVREWRWQSLLTAQGRLVASMRRRILFMIVLIQGYLAFESAMTAISISQVNLSALVPHLSAAQIRGLWIRLVVRLVVTGLISLGSVQTWHDRRRLEGLL